MNDGQILRKCQHWIRIGIALLTAGIIIELSTPFFVSGHFDKAHQLLNQGGIDEIGGELQVEISNAARTETTIRLIGGAMFTAGVIVAIRNYVKKERIIAAKSFARRNQDLIRKHVAQHAPPAGRGEAPRP